MGCYTENWEITRSNYIGKITGINGKDRTEVANKWRKSISDIMAQMNSQLKK